MRRWWLGGLGEIAVALAWLSAPSARADTQSEIAARPPQLVELQGFMTASASTLPWTEADRQSSLAFTLAPALRIGQQHRLVLAAGFVHDFRVLDGSTQFTQGRLGISRVPYQPLPGLMIIPRLSVRLPFNERSREAESFVGGAQADVRVAYDLSRVTDLPVSLFGSVSGFRNLHIFSTAVGGQPNFAWELSESLGTEIAVTEWLSVLVIATVSHAWSYELVPRSFFEMTQGVQFMMSQNLFFTVGHSNSGNTLRANGVDTNVTLFDPAGSSVYGSLSFNY